MSPIRSRTTVPQNICSSTEEGARRMPQDISQSGQSGQRTILPLQISHLSSEQGVKRKSQNISQLNQHGATMTASASSAEGVNQLGGTSNLDVVQV